MKNNRNSGFTLIELLVVIAIIGVLSSVVLASLSTARNKASDAAIETDIKGIQAGAQLYYDNHNDYGPISASVVSNCNPTPLDLFNDDATIAKQVAAADTANGTSGTVTCNVAADGMSYAVSAELVAVPGTYFCVDSTGVASSTTNALTATDTFCS